MVVHRAQQTFMRRRLQQLKAKKSLKTSVSWRVVHRLQ
jgi:hypothetical protein